MKPTDQQLAIAIACGWTDLGTTCGNILAGTPNKPAGFAGCCIDGQWYTIVPDYLNDLNAMHLAEQVLTNEQAVKMGELLWEAASYSNGQRNHASRDEQSRAYRNATAAQRAEAFLRTLNLWEP